MGEAEAPKPLSLAVASAIPGLFDLVRQLEIPPAVIGEMRSIDAAKDSDLEFLRVADIVLADPDFVAEHLHYLQRCRWVQGTWAGVECVVAATAGQAPPWQMTRFAGYFVSGVVMRYYRCA